MKIKLIMLLLLSTAANGDEIYAQDGTYLGKLGGSPSQYESTANPSGPYGSTWGVNSINNRSSCNIFYLEEINTCMGCLNNFNLLGSVTKSLFFLLEVHTTLYSYPDLNLVN